MALISKASVALESGIQNIADLGGEAVEYVHSINQDREASKSARQFAEKIEFYSAATKGLTEMISHLDKMGFTATVDMTKSPLGTDLGMNIVKK